MTNAVDHRCGRRWAPRGGNQRARRAQLFRRDDVARPPLVHRKALEYLRPRQAFDRRAHPPPARPARPVHPARPTRRDAARHALRHRRGSKTRRPRRPRHPPATPASAALTGKGRKTRHVPLLENTTALLAAYLAEHRYPAALSPLPPVQDQLPDLKFNFERRGGWRLSGRHRRPRRDRPGPLSPMTPREGREIQPGVGAQLIDVDLADAAIRGLGDGLQIPDPDVPTVNQVQQDRESSLVSGLPRTRPPGHPSVQEHREEFGTEPFGRIVLPA
jgi:hypothetical protein